jgi:hypothetical protein
MGLVGLEGFPLFRSEDSSQTKEHAAVRFFEFGASLRDVIDLGQDFTLVRLIRREQRFHRHLLFSHGGAEVHQVGTTLLEDRLHSLLLV